MIRWLRRLGKLALFVGTSRQRTGVVFRNGRWWWASVRAWGRTFNFEMAHSLEQAKDFDMVTTAYQLITGGIFALAGLHAGFAASHSTTFHLVMASGLLALGVLRVVAPGRR